MIYRENNNGWDRRQCWDEEVRMQSSFYEDEHGARVAWYGYDGGGNRAVKLSGMCHSLTQNGNIVTVAALADPVVYPSPLVTLSKRGYTNVAEVESRGSFRCVGFAICNVHPQE